MFSRDLRSSMEHQTDELPGFGLKARKVAVECEGGRTPLDRFGDALVCLENGLPGQQHGYFQRVIKLTEPFINLGIGVADRGHCAP